MPSTVDGQVGNWTNMIGAEAVAARAARQAAPSVESVRCVEYEPVHTSTDLLQYASMRVTFDLPSYSFWCTGTVNETDSVFWMLPSIVDLLKRAMVPDDKTLTALHRLRLSATAPVDFGDPQPAAD